MESLPQMKTKRLGLGLRLGGTADQKRHPKPPAKLCDWTGVFPVCSYVDMVNLKLTSACVIGVVMALASPLRALTSVGATAHPPSISDGAGDNSNPYAVIIDRNVFRLNPPPPPPSAEKKPVDLPKVYLNGIIKVGDDVRVLFSIPPKDAKSQTTYFKLAPGERDDVLELVRVHPDQQEVDVLVSGTAMTLSVLSNSLAGAGGKGATPPGPAAVAHGGPPAPAATATAHDGSSAIIAGGSRDSSPYGNVTVAGGGGGGGVTTIGGGNSASFGGGSGGSGVSVAGGGGGGYGGGGTGPASYGGGASYGGAGVSVAGGTGAQIATTLMSGTQNTGQVGNPVPTQVASPEAQAAAMIIYDALHGGNGPPLPPSVAQAASELSGQGSGSQGPPAIRGGPPPVP